MSPLEAVFKTKTTAFSNQILDETQLSCLLRFLIPYRKLFSLLLYLSLKEKPSRSGKVQLGQAYTSSCIWPHLRTTLPSMQVFSCLVCLKGTGDIKSKSHQKKSFREV